MPDASVRIGVSGISQFKQGMSDAQASVKALDAAIKLNEKSLKASGDAEAYMATQTNLLNEKLQQQRNIARNAQQALEQMRQNGVKESSKTFQDMQRQMVEAQSAAMDTEAQLKGLGTAATNTAEKTDKLATSLGGLNKKVSLDQVISAVNSVTDTMERAARKAADLGKAIWENIVDTARYSDDVATQAMNLNMDVETYQRYKGVFDTIGEITVQEWQKAKQKVQKAINDPTQDQTDILALLGIKTHETATGKYGEVQGAAREFEEVFWEIGKVLRQKVASGELTQDLADTYANAIFGRGFSGLNSLFDLGQEGFAAALKEQAAASEEAIKKNAELNDKLIKLQNDFQAVKTEVTSGLTPALSGVADAISKVLNSILEYLQKPEGQEALDKLSESVTGLFEDLTEIDPEDVVNNFINGFNSLVDSLTWIKNNWSDVESGLKAIVGVWAGGKVLEGALTLTKLFDGIKGLFGIGGATAAAKAGLEAGAAYGAAFVNAFVAAAPVLAAAMGVVAVATTPALFAQEEAYAKSKEKLDARLKAAEEMEKQNSADAMFVREAAEATVLERSGVVGTKNKDFQAMDDLLMSLKYRQNQQKAELATLLRQAPATNGYNTWNLLNEYWNGAELDPYMVDSLLQNVTDALAGLNKKAEVPVEPKVADPEAAKAAISAAIGTVTIGVVPAIGMPSGAAAAAGALAESANLEAAYRQYIYNQDRSNGTGRIYANGIYSVPFDGMFAVLHKNERVVPARAMSGSRMFNSNLYIENMNMNNGQDADGLAARIAAANKRTMSGFGS